MLQKVANKDMVQHVGRYISIAFSGLDDNSQQHSLASHKVWLFVKAAKSEN